jgi:hypothetical protein
VATPEGKYSVKSPLRFCVRDWTGFEVDNVRFHSLSPRLCSLAKAANPAQNLQNVKQIGLQISSFPEKRNSFWVDAETKH